ASADSRHDCEVRILKSLASRRRARYLVGAVSGFHLSPRGTPMTRSRLVALVVAMLAAAATVTAQPQPQTKSTSPFQKGGGAQPQPVSPPTPAPLVVVLLDYVGDETLTARLKLTPAP